MKKLTYRVILAIFSLIPLILANSSQILSQSIKNNEEISPTVPTTDDNNIDSDPFYLIKSESLGQLTLNLTDEKVIQLIGNPFKKEVKKLWGADGLYHQNWYYFYQGITLNMISETEEGEQSIAFIKVTYPSTLETKRGIKIGSSWEKVNRVYCQEKEEETSIFHQTFVAGSIYGGLIFTFRNGYVSEIFLGAAAE